MKFQCSYCDIESESEKDQIFTSCRANGHEILEMLESVAAPDVAASAAKNFALNLHLLEEWKKDIDPAHVGDDKNKVLAAILLASSKRKGHEQAMIIQKQSSAGGSNLQRT